MPSPHDAAVLDHLIERLLQFRPAPSDDYQMVLTEEELFYLIDRIAQDLYQTPGLLECEAPLTICGDTHGQYTDLISLFDHCGWPPSMRYLFLGKSSETNMSSPHDAAVLDHLIERLLQFRPAPSDDYQMVLTEEELFYIIDRIAQDLYQTPGLLECEAPLTICGDTHGQYTDLISLFDHCGWPPSMRYLFLGDYVDRGKYSIETAALIFLLKLRYPKKFFVLRGNHETASINRVYGFYEECKRRYSIRLWNHFQIAFDSLPVAGLVSNRIFCMHGGLSPDLVTFDQLRNLSLPFRCPDEGGMLTDLLWSDPCKGIQGYQHSSRGVSYMFGEDVVAEFIDRQGIDLICRAHQVVENGYEFFAGKRLITIFSAPNYCGEFQNCAGMLYVNKELHCKIQQLKPDGQLPKRKK